MWVVGVDRVFKFAECDAEQPDTAGNGQKRLQQGFADLEQALSVGDGLGQGFSAGDGLKITVTLKLRDGDFQTITRARSLPSAVSSGPQLLDIGRKILAPLLPVPKGIRLLGITLSKFEAPSNRHTEAQKSEEEAAPPPRDLFSFL